MKEREDKEIKDDDDDDRNNNRRRSRNEYREEYQLPITMTNVMINMLKSVRREAKTRCCEKR